jgi:membrane protein
VTKHEEREARDASRDPESSGKTDSPAKMTKPIWKYVSKKTLREFMDDQCTDLAAALTYYAVLSLFPALLAMVSLLGLIGQAERTTDALLGIVDDLAPGTAVDTLQPVVESLTQSNSAGFALVIGIALALWSASGYVGAFGRAMNRIYEIPEGRPFYKLRPLQIVITLIAVILICLVALALVVSGPVAESIGNAIGLGSAAVTAWQFLKWPVLVAVVVLIIAILYYATPNVKQPKFRWVTPGSIIAVVTWALASVAFAFYVANFGNYNKTYGTLAGVIVFLLWLWITNLAILFGAEVNAEIERGRQLQSGMPAEEELQLPAKDTKKIEKSEKKEAEELEDARALRESHGARDAD